MSTIQGETVRIAPPSRAGAQRGKSAVAPSVPPRIKGYPWLGMLPGLLPRGPLPLVDRLVREHGDMIRVHFGPIGEVFVLSHPDHARHVLRDRHENYTKSGGMWTGLRGVIGNGLGASEGELWRRQRRAMQPPFHQRQLAEMTDVMVRVMDAHLERMRSYADRNQAIDLLPRLKEMTTNVIIRTLFSGGGIDEGDVARLARGAAVLISHLGARMWTPFLPSWLPVPGTGRFLETVRVFDEIAYKIVQRRRVTGAASADLLEMLLQTRDADTGEGMGDRQIRDEIVTILFTGADTTGLMLAWTLHLLARHPEAERRVREEVTAVLGDRRPTFEDLRRLGYTKMVLQESLRLYPPGWIMQRTAIEDDEIAGCAIPAGSMVAIFVYGVHRHPGVWARPDEFIPDRFAPGRPGELPPAAHLAFGFGPHQCIGNNLAILEGQMALAMFTQRFRFLPSPASRVEPTAMLALRPRTGLLGELRVR